MIPRTCRVCGCTDSNPCIVNGVACAWSENDLCDFCAYGLDEFPVSAHVHRLIYRPDGSAYCVECRDELVAAEA